MLTSVGTGLLTIERIGAAMGSGQHPENPRRVLHFYKCHSSFAECGSAMLHVICRLTRSALSWPSSAIDRLMKVIRSRSVRDSGCDDSDNYFLQRE